ncbi:hypothetical protein SAMN05421837_112230 [Amycolatopsis pretoriensis]|uniref:TrbL/VirB6 plasmid conjugal transfer protein n=1 Tax=Amycolatopsis pretoriensis TaxID=218821 RepID=A0A1H5RHW3_9PSEU|nr:hypothetical protein [Amycolatopsis pretoriensis]SEF37117.1 hypothetical protein SAMN05421837_112230 [Amycolatopsis pretoriensis]
MRLALALTIAILIALLNPVVATAQTTTNPCEPYPTCLWIPGNQPVPPTPDPDAPPLPLQDDPGHHVHLGGIFSIDDGYGRDLHNYDLFANLPSLLDNPMPAIWLWLGNIGFAVGKYAVGFSVWFTEWAASTQVFDWIKAPARDLESIWQTSVIGELKLREIAMLTATCYLGLLFARGLTTRAWRETASTIAVNVLAIAILTHPVDFLIGDDGVLSLSRDLGADVSSVVMGQEPGGTGNPAAPIGQAFIDNLLVTPWETLNYGTPISRVKGIAGACQYSVKKVLDDGPWSSKDDSTKARELDGCPGDYGKYNEVADGDRALGAWLYAIAMLLFAILVICLNTVQVLAPYLLLFEGLLLALALVAALVPSMQHQLAYRVSSIAATIAKLLAGMAFLAVMTVLLRTLMLADLGPQLVRFAVIDLVVFSGFVFRKRLAANLQRVRGQVSSRLQRLGRPRRAPKALPTPIVPAGPDRVARTVKAGTAAFAETVAPVGRLKERLVTAGRTGGKVGGTALKYTVGAPVSWPQAAQRAQTALTAKGGVAKAALARHAAAAKTYTTAYAGNLGTAAGAIPVWQAASTVLTALGDRPDRPKPSPSTYREPELTGATPLAAGRTPEFTGTDLAVAARGRGFLPKPSAQPPESPLPPAMLPTPVPWAQRLRDRLGTFADRR